MRYSYQVPAALLTELRRLADRAGKSLSALIRSILTEYVETENEERHASGCICADCSDAELSAEND